MSIVFLLHTAVTVLWRLCLFRKRSSETLNQTNDCPLRMFNITPLLKRIVIKITTFSVKSIRKLHMSASIPLA